MDRRTTLALLAAAGAGAWPARSAAQTSPTIRIAGSTTDPYMVPYYASDLGYFTKAGLNVEILTQPIVAGVLQAVAANAADVGQADSIMLGNAVAHGVPLAIFAGGGMYESTSPQTALAVLRDSKIRTAQDLVGQTVAVITLESLSAISVKTWLKASGVDPAAVKFVEVPFPQMIPSMQKGFSVASLIGNPYLGLPEIRVLANTYDAIGSSFYVGAWFARREWLTQNRELARRLAAVIYQTARWANGNRNDSAQILSKYEKLDVGAIRKMVRTGYATSLQPQMISPVLSVAYQYKVLSSPVTAQELVFTL